MIEALIIFLLGTCSHITSSVSCLMFHRNKRTSALQYLISTILRDSGAKKTAFRRLNRMGLTVSAENQRLKTKQMIVQFDQPIRCWKKSLENLSNKTDSEEADESDSVKSTILSDDELPSTICVCKHSSIQLVWEVLEPLNFSHVIKLVYAD